MMPESRFAAVFALAAATTQARDANHDEREILRIEAEICRAFETGDADVLHRHLEPTFTLVDSRGTVTDLAQNVAEVARREPAYEEFRNHGQKIRLHGCRHRRRHHPDPQPQRRWRGVRRRFPLHRYLGVATAHGGWRPATPAGCRADRACAASGGQRNAVFTACWDGRRVSH